MTRIWTWITQRQTVEGTIPATLSNLWLLPVMGQHVRQLLFENEASLCLIVEQGETLYRLFEATLGDNGLAGSQVIDFDVVPHAAIKVLRGLVAAKKFKSGASSDHLDSLLRWLQANRSRFEGLHDQHNDILLQEIAELVRKTKPPIANAARREPLAKKLRDLPLFARMHVDLAQKRWATKRTSVDPHTTAITNAILPPCIELPPGVVLFRFQSKAEKDLQQSLSLVHEITLESLLFEHLIPFTFGSPSADADRYALTEFTLEHSRRPSKRWIESINSHAIVPVEPHAGGQDWKFSRLQDLVDPNSKLAELYSEDENMFPARSLAGYSDALRACGMNTGRWFRSICCHFGSLYHDALTSARIYVGCLPHVS